MLIKLTPHNAPDKELWVESTEIKRIERTTPKSSLILRPRDEVDNVTFIQTAMGVFPVDETPEQIINLINGVSNVKG